MTIDNRTLDARLADLPRVVESPPEPWLGIEERLHAPRRPRWRVAGAAAAIAASLALAIVVVDQPETQGPAATIITAEAEAMREQAPARPAGTGFNAELADAWDTNQMAIAELEAAIDHHPDHSMLIEFLAQARLRQSNLIYQAAVGGAAAPTRST